MVYLKFKRIVQMHLTKVTKK